MADRPARDRRQPAASGGARAHAHPDRRRPVPHESPEGDSEGDSEGILAIDTEASPPHFDLHFIAGPEAGNTSHGIYQLEGADRLTLCLGLAGAPRPQAFSTRPGSGHALEHLRRSSTARPTNVRGGTPLPPAPPVVAPREDAAAFPIARTPLLERLQGEWRAIELVTDGKPMLDRWLDHGSRTMIGNGVKVVFGGQTMVHAKVRIDEGSTPIAVDYLNLLAKQSGIVTFGIME